MLLDRSEEIGNHESIAILGCGISGLALAQKLSPKGGRIVLFDVYNRIGGNHISVNIGPFSFDIGTFIFYSDGEFFQCFPNLQQLYLPAKPRFGRINPLGVVDAYPFSLSGYYRQHSLPSFIQDILGLLLSKLIHFRKKDVPGYAKYYLGKGIYVKSGLKNYIERFYGIPDHTIDLQFALKRMSEIGSSASLRNKLRRPFTKKKIKQPRTPLIRPQCGFENGFRSLQSQMETLGIEFRLGAEVDAITRVGSSFALHQKGKAELFDRVISTIPINETLEKIGAEKVSGIDSQRLVSLFIKLDGRLNFEDNVLYNFMDDGPWKRMTIYSRFYGKVEGQEYFGVEVPLGPREDFLLEPLFASIQEHLRRNGIFEGHLTLLGSHILENAYPIYTTDSGPGILKAKKTLLDFGIELAGRQGNFDYIPAADLAVRKVSKYLHPSEA